MRRDEKLMDRYDHGRGSQFLDFISKEIKGKSSKNSNVMGQLFRVETFLAINHLIEEESMISFHRLRSQSQEEEQVWSETVRLQSMRKVWASLERISSRIVMSIMTIKTQAIVN